MAQNTVAGQGVKLNILIQLFTRVKGRLELSNNDPLFPVCFVLPLSQLSNIMKGISIGEWERARLKIILGPPSLTRWTQWRWSLRGTVMFRGEKKIGLPTLGFAGWCAIKYLERVLCPVPLKLFQLNCRHTSKHLVRRDKRKLLFSARNLPTGPKLY